jgi:hypothetical protein
MPFFTNVPKHQARTHEKCRGIRHVLPHNVGRSPVDGLEDGTIFPNISTWSESQATYQSGTQIAYDIPIQIWHQHHGIIEFCGIDDDLKIRID